MISASREASAIDPTPTPRLEAWALSALTLLALAFATHDDVYMAGNDASRFAQIEALVDHGQTHIDASRYWWTQDRVAIEGRLYSNKPPLLAVVGAGVYFVLREAFGWTFERESRRIVYWITLTLVGGTAAWLVASFHGALARHGPLPRAVRLSTTLALATGTILTSFAVSFNNHTVAAALLFAAFRSACSRQPGRAGLWLGLSSCVDIVPGLVFVPALALVASDPLRTGPLLRYGSALALGALLFAAVNLAIVGHPLPPRYVPGAVGLWDRALPHVAGVQLPESWHYPIECLFGWHGFFSVSPVLLFGAAGLARAVRQGRPLPASATLALGVATTVVVLGHALLAGAFGGWSYGFRYLIPVVPILLFFVPLALERSGVRPFQAVLVVSAGFAWLGAYHPWPPGYERVQDRDALWSVVTNPVGANAAAWLHRHAPERALTRWAGATFIHPDARLRQRYLGLFERSRHWGEARKVPARTRPGRQGPRNRDPARIVPIPRSPAR